MKCSQARPKVQDAAASGDGSCCFRSWVDGRVWGEEVASRESGRCVQVGEESVGKLLCGVNACRLAWNVPMSRSARAHDHYHIAATIVMSSHTMR